MNTFDTKKIIKFLVKNRNYMYFLTCLFIHIVYFTTFFIANLHWMSFLNVFSIIFYSFFLFIRKKVDTFAMLCMYFEITTFATISTVMFGRICGFDLYIIGMVAFIAQLYNKNIFKRFIFQLIGILEFLSLYIFEDYHTSLLTNYKEYVITSNTHSIMWICNACVISFTVVCTSLLYGIDNNRLLKAIGKAMSSANSELLSDSDESSKNVVVDIDSTENIDKVCAGIQNMVGNLVHIINNIKEKSNELNLSSEEMESLANTANSSMKTFTSYMEKVADGSKAQVADAILADDNVKLMGQSILDTLSQIDILKNASNRMQTTSNNAKESLNQLKISVDEVNHSTETINEQILLTNNVVEQISSATELITNITSETELLSLNAHIESARAGEVGKGFGVVAMQIQALATQSDAITREIQNTLKNLVDVSSKSVSTMKDVKEIINIQSSNMEETSIMFGTVEDEIKKSVQGINAIFSSTHTLESSRQSVEKVVKNLADLSTENSEFIQETSNSVKQLDEMISSIDNDAKNLKDIAGVLESLV